MAFIFMATGNALPDVLVRNIVGMLGCHMNITMAECCANFGGPNYVSVNDVSLDIMVAQAYQALNSFPWGLSLIPLIMKFAR